MKKFQPAKIQNGRPAATLDRQIFSLKRFTRTFFYVSLQNLYQISISLIARMSSRVSKFLVLLSGQTSVINFRFISVLPVQSQKALSAPW